MRGGSRRYPGYSESHGWYTLTEALTRALLLLQDYYAGVLWSRLMGTGVARAAPGC